jgi:hypothetical protein
VLLNKTILGVFAVAAVCVATLLIGVLIGEGINAVARWGKLDAASPRELTRLLWAGGDPSMILLNSLLVGAHPAPALHAIELKFFRKCPLLTSLWPKSGLVESLSSPRS